MEKPNAHATLAAMTMLAASAGPVPSFTSTERHAPIRGNICGRDSIQGVKTARRKQPRNRPCLCGSGRKAKKCCRYVPTSPEESDEQRGPIDDVAVD